MRRFFVVAVLTLLSLPCFSQTVKFNQIKVGSESGPVVGDFNGDGREDMIYFVPTNFDTFRMLVSTGTGTYRDSTTYPIPGGRSLGYVVGDFNNDGKLDLVMMGGIPSSLYFYKGNGDGTFQQPVKSSITASAPNGITAEDVNHDGKMDIVISDSTDQTSYIETYFGYGSGTFTAGPVTQNNFNTFALRSGDFDGDGHADLMTTDCGTDGCLLVIFYGDGKGNFPANFSVGAGQLIATVADVDDDGRSDIISSNTGNSNQPDQPNLSVFYGNADRTLTSSQITTSECTSGQPIAADFNGNHVTDIIFFQHTCGSSGSAEITFIAGNGNRTFGAEQTIFNSTFVQQPGQYAATVRANNSDSTPDFFFNQFESSGSGTAQQMYAMVNITSGTFAGCRPPNSATGFRICSPLSGASVTSPVKFSFGAAWQVPVRKTEVWVDGVKKFQSRYAFSHYGFLDANLALSKGTHAITIDSAGWDNSIQSKKYSITVH
jgi:hypothetical protein